MGLIVLPTVPTYVWVILIGLLVLLAIVVAVLSVFFPDRLREYRYGRKEFLMTPSERLCFAALRTAAGPDHYVFPQIHLDCLVWPNGRGKERFANWRHVNEKSVDFVICDPSLRPLIAVELDDPSHDRPKRIERDRIVTEILKEVELPLLRLRGAEATNVAALADRIQNALHPPQPAVSSGK